MALAATTLLLAGCEDVLGKKLRAWWFSTAEDRTASSSAIARVCNDVRGTFSLATPAAQGRSFDIWSTFLAADVRQQRDNPWQTLTIGGNPDTVLELTYARPAKSAAPPGDKSVPAYIRYALETPQSQPIEKKSATVQRGVHYECKRGWLKGIAQSASIQREHGGDLTGRSEERTARVFSLWAETGAGIPYWFDTTILSARWVAVSPSSAGVAGPSRPMSALEKQEFDLTYGKGSAKDRAAGTSARAAAPISDAPYDVTKEIRAHIDRNASLESIRFEDKRYVVTLRVESRGALLRTLENLRDDRDMQDIQEHGVVSGGTRPDIATISLRVVR